MMAGGGEATLHNFQNYSKNKSDRPALRWETKKLEDNHMV